MRNCVTIKREKQKGGRYLWNNKAYIAEIEADIMPIDGLIAFAESEMGAKVFGDNAANVAAHAHELKNAGKKYCDCPACAACEAILEKKDAML